MINDIKNYRNSIFNKNVYYQTKLFIITIVLLLFILVGIVTFYKYDNYLNYSGVIVNSNEPILKIYIEEKNIEKIINGNLYINGNKSRSNIIEISSDYFLDEKSNKYRGVLIECDIESKLLIKNNVINIRYKIDDTTIMKELIRRIKRSWFDERIK